MRTFFGLRFFLLFLLGIFFFSCKAGKPVDFPVKGTSAKLLAPNAKSAAGIIEVPSGNSKPKRLEYQFEHAPSFSDPASLEISYAFSTSLSQNEKDAYHLVLELGENDYWILPLDLSFLGIEYSAVVRTEVFDDLVFFHYSIPISNHFIKKFSITLDSDGKKQKIPFHFQLWSLEFRERWHGFYQEDTDDAKHYFATPFVYVDGEELVHMPPVVPEPPELLVTLNGGRDGVIVTHGTNQFESLPFARTMYIPPPFINNEAGEIRVSGGLPMQENVTGFQLRYPSAQDFPAPIKADPGLVLDWPLELWRDKRYEVFCWEAFPSLLILDTADYAVQDKLFKRLAFFAEKAGFRGRLVPDDEIAGMHGWNAHDYRAEDLGRFYDMARQLQFPLLPEERELEQILLDAGIIRQEANGSIQGGDGGILSISRESTDYLRQTFMAHEGFHGLFFIDEDFRNFTRSRWLALPQRAKTFITNFFEFQQYDIADEYLLHNEFMAHIMQQSVSRAAFYFGESLPKRLETSWRRSALGEKDEASGTWPYLANVFTKEAEAFSAYTLSRWGLPAGRVWQMSRTSQNISVE